MLRCKKKHNKICLFLCENLIQWLQDWSLCKFVVISPTLYIIWQLIHEKNYRNMKVRLTFTSSSYVNCKKSSWASIKNNGIQSSNIHQIKQLDHALDFQSIFRSKLQLVPIERVKVASEGMWSQLLMTAWLFYERDSLVTGGTNCQPWSTKLL